MRWIMSTESEPPAAMPAAVPFKILSTKTQLEKSITCLKRSMKSDPLSQITGTKRKYAKLRQCSDSCTSTSISFMDTVNHANFPHEFPDGESSSASTYMERFPCPLQLQSTDELRRKEKYALQIQRAMIADEDGDRPIHISVIQEDANLVQKLCKLMKAIGASLDIFNNMRQTPLHLAIIVGNPSIIKVLLQHGASINVKDRRGKNAIQLAVKFFRQECFQVLLDDPSSRSALDSLDYEGLSAVHYAVIYDNMSAVNFLYHCGADINSTDGKSGRSALTQAVLHGNIEMVQLLLKCGAAVTKTDYSGLSALDAAHQMNNKEIIQLLEKEAAAKQDSEKEVDITDTFRTHMAYNSTKSLQASQKKKIRKNSLQL